MNKKILALIAAGIAAVSLIGCGEDPNAPRYAFVTNSKGTAVSYTHLTLPTKA